MPTQNAAARRRRRAAGVLRRERDLGAAAPCASWSRRSPTRGSATSAARRGFVDQGGSNQEGAYWRSSSRSASSSRRSPGSPPATARSTRFAARRTSRSAAAASHDLSFPFMLTKRGWRAVYAPDAVAEERMVADDRGRVRAQAADDARHLGRGRRATGCSRRAATGPPTRGRSPATALLRYASPLLHLVALGDEHRPARRGDRSTRSRSPPRLRAARRGRARRRRCPLAPLRIARYYVLDDRLDRRRALGPGPARDARGLGEGARGRGEPRPAARARPRDRRGRACCSPRRCC